jgi:hypothetical protein
VSVGCALQISRMHGILFEAQPKRCIDGRAIRPFVSAYVLVIGMLILIKAARLVPADEDAKAMPRRSALSAGFWMRSAAADGDRWSPRR